MHYKNSIGERELLLTNNNKPVEYIDGGLIRNFPINIFDKVKYVKKEEETVLDPDLPCYNEKTLGIRFFYECKIFFLIFIIIIIKPMKFSKIQTNHNQMIL